MGPGKAKGPEARLANMGIDSDKQEGRGAGVVSLKQSCTGKTWRAKLGLGSGARYPVSAGEIKNHWYG